MLIYIKKYCYYSLGLQDILNLTMKLLKAFLILVFSKVAPLGHWYRDSGQFIVYDNQPQNSFVCKFTKVSRSLAGGSDWSSKLVMTTSLKLALFVSSPSCLGHWLQQVTGLVRAVGHGNQP